MDLRNIRLEDIGKKKITIGKVAENLRTCIGFDCADIFAEYPDAVPALTVINPRGISYPAIVQRSGNSVLWEIRNSDLTAAGTGEIQLSFVQDEVIAKSYTGRIEVIRSIQSTGEAPDPITEWETEANAKLAEVAQALEDIPQAIDDALTAAKESGEFKGDKGDPGEDGYTPVKGVDYFDGKDGQDGVDGKDGQDGQDGQDGTDGISPTVTVTDITGGHHVVITDAEGDHQFDVMDGTTPTEPMYRLIKEVTLSEAQKLICIDTDQTGSPFSLTDVVIVLELTVGSGSGYGFIVPNVTTHPYDQIVNIPNLSVADLLPSSAITTIANLHATGGKFFADCITNTGNYYQYKGVQSSKNALGFLDCDPISSLFFFSANGHSFGVGTKFTVYGR